MKLLKLTWAEIKKILLKPTFFIMVACLFVAIIISSFLFAPTERKAYVSEVSGENLTRIYNNFTKESPTIKDGIYNLRQEIDQQYLQIEQFNNQSKLEELQSQVGVVFKSYFYQLEDAISHASYNTAHLINLYNSCNDLLDYFGEIEIATQAYDYLIKQSDFARFNTLLRNIKSTLPNSREDIEALENNYSDLAVICRSIWNNYKQDVDNMIVVCQNLQKLQLSPQFMEETQQFKTEVLSFLDKQEQTITKFYQENILQTNNPPYILQLKDMLNNYKASAKIAVTTLINMVNINRLTSVGGNENEYLGFEKISLYKLNEETSFYKYLIKNQIDYSSALTALNFSVNSGLTTNCFDFALFLTTISSLILSLMLIYFACMIFSGERHDGLMRMNLTKPCSRTKLYFAKVFALIILSFVAHLLLGLIFLLVGVCIYPSASGCILISVFGSDSAFAVLPFGNYILKLFCMFLSSVFYILLACLISNLFSNPVFSVVISYLVYIFALITNSLLATTQFIKFLPFIHLDFSFFFGGGIWGQGFLSSLIYSGANFALSIIYYTVCCGIFILTSCIAFKKQEL